MILQYCSHCHYEYPPLGEALTKLENGKASRRLENLFLPVALLKDTVSYDDKSVNTTRQLRHKNAAVPLSMNNVVGRLSNRRV